MQCIVSRLRRPCVNVLQSTPSAYGLLGVQTRTHVSKVKKYKLKTKNAAKKRFQLTSRGDVKSHPTRMSGKSRVWNRRSANNGYRSLLTLLPNATKMSQSFKLRTTATENKQKKKLRKIQEAEAVPTAGKKRIHPTGPPQHPLLPGYMLKNYRQYNASSE